MQTKKSKKGAQVFLLLAAGVSFVVRRRYLLVWRGHFLSLAAGVFVLLAAGVFVLLAAGVFVWLAADAFVLYTHLPLLAAGVFFVCPICVLSFVWHKHFLLLAAGVWFVLFVAGVFCCRGISF